jgi:hypothetical protein
MPPPVVLEGHAGVDLDNKQRFGLRVVDQVPRAIARTTMKESDPARDATVAQAPASVLVRGARAASTARSAFHL